MMIKNTFQSKIMNDNLQLQKSVITDLLSEMKQFQRWVVML